MTDIAATLADIGPRWHLDIRAHSQQVKDAYEPILARAPRGDLTVFRDIAYGPHGRQVLDVFAPAAALAGAPVVAYVHGGAFLRGDKRTTDQIYDNVLFWFARQGFVGVNVEYRHAPQATYPGGAEDVAAAMAWVQQRIAGFGGDPARVLLIGHSAGGTHAATYAFDPAVAAVPPQIAALALVSARLRADRLAANPNAAGVAAYFGADASSDDARSPVSHAARHPELPVMIAVAEFENPLLDVYGIEFAQRRAAALGRAPRFVQMPGHNHMSIVAHFNSGEETLGREILDFFSRVG
ncbi:MAG TPA: alpha/beta hydrolase fold domain-containing protein [Caldimonas sp.]|nr:alpha/beta hydrolase fold domain-containing protein [Caldimonas sp.]